MINWYFSQSLNTDLTMINVWKTLKYTYTPVQNVSARAMFNVFQWSLVMDHWSNDAMVSMDRWPLYQAIFNRAVFSISKVDSYQSSMLTTWIHLGWNIFWPRWPPPHRMAAAKGWGKKRNIIWAPPPFHGWTPSLMELRRGSWPLIGASRNGAPILRYTVLLC